jgi:dTDP-4-dehydrorhamnose reductase
MSWLVTGGSGMLGSDLVACLEARGERVAAPGHAELDLLEADAVAAFVDRHRPDFVVNCAAWTAVDAAEQHEAEALAINGTAVTALAAACERTGARLIQISTDYVLDGLGDGPQPEDAPTGPINAYGRTKLAGERAALATTRGWIVRTAWLYGANGPSFPRTILRLAAERETLDVVDDQIGQPTWTVDVAERIVALAATDAPKGIYHATGSGRTSWYGLAQEIFTLQGWDPARVRPTTSAAFPRPARRPANSRLGHAHWSAIGLPPLRHWREALHSAWPELVRAWS